MLPRFIRLFYAMDRIVADTACVLDVCQEDLTEKCIPIMRNITHKESKQMSSV